MSETKSESLIRQLHEKIEESQAIDRDIKLIAWDLQDLYVQIKGKKPMIRDGWAYSESEYVIPPTPHIMSEAFISHGVHDQLCKVHTNVRTHTYTANRR